MAGFLSKEDYVELYGNDKPMTRGEALDYFKLETVNGETFLTFEAACLWLAFADIGKPDLHSAAKRVLDVYYPALQKGLDNNELINATAFKKFLNRDDLPELFQFRIWLAFVNDDLEVLAKAIKKKREGSKANEFVTVCIKAYGSTPATAEQLIKFAVSGNIQGYSPVNDSGGAYDRRIISWDGDSVYFRRIESAFTKIIKDH